MFSLKNDYSEGAHPRILQKMIETNLVQQAGYGDDDYTREAKALLKQKMENPNAEIYFVSGGTQANLLVISGLLRVHEAAISAQTGHIYCNETGAIEATGHKVIPVPTVDGKLRAADIEQVISSYTMRPHVVLPRLVYISNSTEIGSIYTKSELEALSACCHKHNLLLFVDGARIGSALTCAGNDLTLADMARLTDAFYIGATKNGGIFGEAIVFNNKDLAPYFDYSLKQKGALLAKGRYLGIQFLELFRDDLYFTLAAHANAMAKKITDAVKEAGFSFLTDSPTNQVFPILPRFVVAELAKNYEFYTWKEVDENYQAIRLITAWDTEEEHIDRFIADFKMAVNQQK